MVAFIRATCGSDNFKIHKMNGNIVCMCNVYGRMEFSLEMFGLIATDFFLSVCAAECMGLVGIYLVVYLIC